MDVSIVVAIIAALIAVAGLYYLIKNWSDPESRKIYGVIAGIGIVVLIVVIILKVVAAA